MFKITNLYCKNDSDLTLIPYMNAFVSMSDETLYSFNDKSYSAKENGESVICYSSKNEVIKSTRIDGETFDIHTNMKIAIYEAIKDAKKMNCKRVVVSLKREFISFAKDVVEGGIIGSYVFNKYKTKKEDMPECVFYVTDDLKNEVEDVINSITNTCNWVNIARDLVNEPFNKLSVNSFVNYMNDCCKKIKVKTTIWDEKKLIKESCNGIVSVGSGGKEKAKLFMATYAPKNAKKHIALVGKGVVYDNGGMCIKPGDEQVESKLDMAGAAMMFSSFCSIVEQKLPIKVSLIIPVVENAVSSSSYHVGDVLTMNNGITVEVADTDAEGRLILADALSVASKFNPDIIVDSATLTGSCCSGLGLDIAGVLTNNDDIFLEDFFKATKNAGENMWYLPLHKGYEKNIESNIADYKNYNHGGYGDVINSSLLLSKFVGENIDWIHIDIAGPGYQQEEYQHFCKGSKGFGVRSIVEYMKNFIDNNKCL